MATTNGIPDIGKAITNITTGTLLESDDWQTWHVWGYGFLFVTMINLSSVMGIVFFPLMNKKIYTTIMRVMIGLAIGSLSGSALFHLIPKALKLKEDSLNTLAFVWISIWFVMILECAMKIGLKSNKKTEDDTGMPSEISNLQNNNPCRQSIPVVTIDNEEMVNGNVFPESYKSSKIAEDIEGSNNLVNQLPIYHSTFSLNKHAVESLRKTDGQSSKDTKDIKTVAWVIIFGDGLHNFIDGVSIGAAFVTSFSTGAVICLAIFCEEFPHELGDFAILINSGLSVKKALLFNFMSAMTCYLGLILGIMLGGGFDWSYYIFAVAAGIFLYVALGDMVPEVTAIIEEVSDVSPRKAWFVLLVHHLGILVGISILFILAKFLPE